MGVWKSTSHNEIYTLWSQKGWWIICWQSIFHSGIHTPFPNTTTSNSRLCLQASCYMHTMLMWTAQIHHMYPPPPSPAYIYNTSPYRGTVDKMRHHKCVCRCERQWQSDSPSIQHIYTIIPVSSFINNTMVSEHTEPKALIWRLFHCHVRQKGPPLLSAVMK